MQKLKVLVSGTQRGRAYTTPVTFTLVPPKTRDYYGNGHYMNVDLPGSSHYVDARYSMTTDLEKLARIWIKDYFGNTVKDIKTVEQG